MLMRILIALAAIGVMGLAAFAQTPELNEAARRATAESIIKGKSTCAECDLFQVDLSFQELPGLDLSRSRLRQADLTLSTFDKGKFTGANMSIVNAFGMRAENADFSKVDFADATLVGGSFDGSIFTAATFDNANLSGSDFETAKGLTQTQLNTTCSDADTKLPKGLKLTACKN